MKIPKIANAVGYIDDDLIKAAGENKRTTKRKSWVKRGAIAACIAVCIALGAIFLPSVIDKSFQGDKMPEAPSERYKNVQIGTNEFSIVWPWEYKTVYEKYTNLNINGVWYDGKRRAVSANLVSEKIGIYTVSGYDYTDIDTHKKYFEDFEVYSLKYADKSECVAVKMEGTYYAFMRSAYTPSKLEELFALIDFPNAIKLNRFSVNNDRTEKGYYSLSNGEYVWDVLAKCGDAAFIKDDSYKKSGEYLNFTITSETLGVYKVVMYITADGYLETNMFYYSYLFFIGADAAREIIRYAKENSEETDFEPYLNSVVGKITDITDECITINDSVLCNNPSDGIEYKISMQDLRISRYVELNQIAKGSIVCVQYSGEIGEGNIVEGVTNIMRARISANGVEVPE